MLHNCSPLCLPIRQWPWMTYRLFYFLTKMKRLWIMRFDKECNRDSCEIESYSCSAQLEINLLIYYSLLLLLLSYGSHDSLFNIVKKRKLNVVWTCDEIIRLGKNYPASTVPGERQKGRQKKRWEDNICEWADLSPKTECNSWLR